MREFKFRVWDGKKLHTQVDQIVFSHDTIQHGTILDHGIPMLVRSDKAVWMQYTGLKDKYGTEIFEGDTVEYRGYEVSRGKQIRPKRKFVVGEKEGWIIDCFHIENIVKSKGTLEVIGNIFENPELIEKSEIGEDIIDPKEYLSTYDPG